MLRGVTFAKTFVHLGAEHDATGTYTVKPRYIVKPGYFKKTTNDLNKNHDWNSTYVHLECVCGIAWADNTTYFLVSVSTRKSSRYPNKAVAGCFNQFCGHSEMLRRTHHRCILSERQRQTTTCAQLWTLTGALRLPAANI